MLRGESALSYACRIRAESQDVCATSRSVRDRSDVVRAASRQTRAQVAQAKEVRGPYARVHGTRSGEPVEALVWRDGSVSWSRRPAGHDPLRATVGAARQCDEVASIDFRRAGQRPTVPFVQATAQLDTPRPPDPVHAVREQIAAQLTEGVVKLMFEAGLAVTSVLAHTTDVDMQTKLASVVETLDKAVAELRSAIFQIAAPDPDGKTPPAF